MKKKRCSYSATCLVAKKKRKQEQEEEKEDICLKTCIIQSTDLTFTWYQYKQEQ